MKGLKIQFPNFDYERIKDTTSKFLLRLKTRLGYHYDPQSRLVADLIRHRILDRMDPQIRLNLYHYESCSVDEFASHADRLLIRIKKTESATILSPTHSAEDKSSNQSLISQLKETRFRFFTAQRRSFLSEHALLIETRQLS